MANEKENKYNFDVAIEKNEETTVQNAAVVKAKQKMAEEQLERDARMVQSRLEMAERNTRTAEREGRYASKKKNILKKYSEGLQEVKAQFEADGDWKKYDEASNKLLSDRRDAIQKAKEEVYGEEAWSIRD